MVHPLWILFWLPLKNYGYDKFSLLTVAQMYLSFAAWKITFLDISSQVLLKTDEMTYWYKSILYRISYMLFCNGNFFVIRVLSFNYGGPPRPGDNLCLRVPQVSVTNNSVLYSMPSTEISFNDPCLSCIVYPHRYSINTHTHNQN